MDLDQTFALEPTIFADQPTLVAGFSTRHGGVSGAPFGSLNLGLSTGDDEAAVLENRRRLVDAIGFRLDRLAVAGQVHGAEVKTTREPGLYPGFDALVTDAPDLLLCISAADCAAVLLADVEAGVVGACHSGWRGTVARIAARTLDAMQALGAQPERVQAYISPCISTEHFEVGPEVAAQFDPAFVETREAWPRPHVDLKGAIAATLVEAGIPAEQIETSPRCTVGETDTFFSYRAEAGQTGRMMGFIGMKCAAD